MDWHCLGHATWLAEVDGLRLLFDPLLDNPHHGGVFEVYPPRAINTDALRADFIFISHRHPDHFDIESLRRLAAIDPDSVVVTSDELVASCARRIGFHDVRVVRPETTIDLDGPRVITTPSVGAIDPEWGVVVSTKEGAVYNQVDTAAGSTAADVHAFFDRVASAIEQAQRRSPLLALALARWQPLLEVEAVTAGPIGFPFRAYADELARVSALDARVVCPSSAGAKHAGPHAFMNRLVYPIDQERFLRDARARFHKSTMRVEPCITGATYRVRDGDVAAIDHDGARELVSLTPNPAASATDDPRSFRPLEIPPITDPNITGQTEEHLIARVEHWVKGRLAPALAHQARIRFLLEVIFPSTTHHFTIVDGRVDHKGEDPSWDVRCAVAGSMLVDVIEERRHWGDLLLGGMLRSCSRAYEVNTQGLRAISLQPLFVYEAISYEQSVVRAVETGIVTTTSTQAI